MNLSLLIDKVRLALLKRSGKAQGANGRTYEGWKSKGYIKEPLISFIIQSHEKSLQVCHILGALRSVPESEIIVIDDGSSIEHTERLARELTGTNEFLVRANDLYENVMYDKCLRFANGRYVALLQDDDDIQDGEWARRAVELFRQYPDMAILGGCDGREVHFFVDEKGRKCYRSEEMSREDFCFVMSVNRAPMWINHDLYKQHLRHIDYSFAPFQSDDYELCLRAWTLGLKVGWYRLHLPSLSVGGMRIYNNSFTREMTERNMPLLYDLYADKEESILDRVEQANKR